MRLALTALATTVGLLGGFGIARAVPEPYAVTLTLKNHRFSPETIEVPAGRLLRIKLVNEDGTSEEFDSSDLKVEKDVTPYGKVSFTVGPLKPGTYSFIGELHADTAGGTLVAVTAP
jgi:hypothetical protein